MKRRLLIVTICASVLAIATLLLSTTVHDAPPDMVVSSQQAHEVIVVKATRELHLLRNGATFKQYQISLGAAPQGHKTKEGDERTPEGRYKIDWRNPNSIAHLSLHISYPNADDRTAAEIANVSPGGNIMVHGIANGWGWLGKLHLLWDWTDGCVAVTNAQMREIWAHVPNGTPITIVDKI